MAVVHNLLPRIIKSGLGVLPPTRGVAALELMLRRQAAPPAQMVVSPFEWHKLMAGADRVFPVQSQSSLVILCQGGNNAIRIHRALPLNVAVYLHSATSHGLLVFYYGFE